MKNKMILFPLLIGILGSSLLALVHPILIIAGVLFALFTTLWAIHFALSATRGRTSLEASARYATEKYLRYVGASLLYAAIVIAGFFLLIIPGVYLGIRLGLFQYAIVGEDKKLLDSLRRSWELTKGRWWLTFGVGLLIALLALIVILPVVFITLAISGSVQMSDLLGDVASIFFSGWSIAAYAVLFLHYTKRLKRLK